MFLVIFLLIELRRNGRSAKLQVTFYCYYNQPSQSSASPKPPYIIMLLGPVAASVPVPKQVPVCVHSVEAPNTLSGCVRPVHMAAVVAALVLHAHFSPLAAFRSMLGGRQIYSGSSSDCKFEISTGGMCWGLRSLSPW